MFPWYLCYFYFIISPTIQILDTRVNCSLDVIIHKFIFAKNPFKWLSKKATQHLKEVLHLQPNTFPKHLRPFEGRFFNILSQAFTRQIIFHPQPTLADVHRYNFLAKFAKPWKIIGRYKLCLKSWDVKCTNEFVNYSESLVFSEAPDRLVRLLIFSFLKGCR